MVYLCFCVFELFFDIGEVVGRGKWWRSKAAYWTVTDVEARKRGEQTGLDTLVVHAVNDEC